jgi:hypothetical protein
MVQACVVHRKSPQFGKEMLCQAHHRESRIKSQIYTNQGKGLSINFTGRFSLATRQQAIDHVVLAHNQQVMHLKHTTGIG